jgi:hypothetical protein
LKKTQNLPQSAHLKQHIQLPLPKSSAWSTVCIITLLLYKIAKNRVG